MQGIVSKIQKNHSKPHRSYGFIKGTDGNSYWFPLIGIDEINIGENVHFQNSTNEKGLLATEIKRVTK